MANLSKAVPAIYLCRCRNRDCGKSYDARKARGDWKGFCSARCQHAVAKQCGYSRSRNSRDRSHTEYAVLRRVGLIGDVFAEPATLERVSGDETVVICERVKTLATATILARGNRDAMLRNKQAPWNWTWVLVWPSGERCKVF